MTRSPTTTHTLPNPTPHGLACTTPAVRFTTANAVARNPLVVQFWLLGIDAARGDLGARGFRKDASLTGSSTYTCGDLTLHSAGLWLRLPDQTLHYLRPRGTFYQLPATHSHPRDAQQQPAQDAHPLHRAHGLNLIQAHLLEHEAWIAQAYDHAYRAQLLTGKLPPKVRRLVPAWEAWIARQVKVRRWHA